MTDLIKEELNVKEVMYTNETSDYLTYTVKPNFKEVGKLFGKILESLVSLLVSLLVKTLKILKVKLLHMMG